MPVRGPDHVLNAVRNFISTIVWAPDEHLDAFTLILAVTHAKSAFGNVPYALVTGPKGTGKSTLSKNVPLLLASNPWGIDRMTSTEAMRNRFLDANSPDSLLFDDASKQWGEDGRHGLNTMSYQLAVNAYEDNGKVSVSRNGSNVDVQTYAVAFLNGLGNAVPDDVRSRCIVFPITVKPEGIRKRSARSKPVMAEAEPLKRALHNWAASHRKQVTAFMLDQAQHVHPRMDNRLLQLWGPLFAFANEAGGTWPQRCMNAFLTLGLDESEKPVALLDDQVLLDSAQIALSRSVTQLFTADLVAQLRELPNGKLYRDLGNEDMVDLLDRALGESAAMRGRTLDGRMVTGRGRPVAPVLRAAAELHDELNPQPEARRPTRAQQELALTEVSR